MRCLEYSMKYSGTERRILEAVQSQNLKMPPEIADAPEVPLGLELFYGAFWDLSSTREIGMGTGPIPWTAMKDYAEAFDLDEDQTDDLMFYVRELDEAWLRLTRPKPAKSKGPIGQKGKKWRPADH